MEYVFAVRNQEITQSVTDKSASGTLNYPHARFVFDEAWAGMVKTAVFHRAHEGAFVVILDKDDKCVFPAEVMQKAGYVRVGVFGIKGDVRITSLMCSLKVGEGAYTEGSIPDATPDIYTQIADLVATRLARVEHDDTMDGDGTPENPLTAFGGGGGDGRPTSINSTTLDVGGSGYSKTVNLKAATLATLGSVADKADTADVDAKMATVRTSIAALDVSVDALNGDVVLNSSRKIVLDNGGSALTDALSVQSDGTLVLGDESGAGVALKAGAGSIPVDDEMELNPAFSADTTANLKEENRIVTSNSLLGHYEFHIDRWATHGETGDGSLAYPFTSWDALQSRVLLNEDDLSSTEVIVNIAASGADTTPYQVTLDPSLEVGSLIIQSNAHAPGYSKANVALTLGGAVSELVLSGIVLATPLGIPAFKDLLVVNQCTIDRGMFLSGEQDEPDEYGYISFEKCIIHGDMTIGGDAPLEIGFYECWAEPVELPDRSVLNPSLVSNNPNADIIFCNSIDVGGTINQCHYYWSQNCNYVPSTAGGYALTVSDSCTGNIELITGTARSTGEQALHPIYIGENCTFTVGAFEFMRVGSQLKGTFNTSGVGSVQVRDNDVRPGFKPVKYASDTYGKRSVANTLKDQLNGISNQLVADRAILASDRFLRTTPVVLDENGNYVSGGQEIALHNKSTQGQIILEDKTGAEFLNFDVAALAAAGVKSVNGMKFNDPYWNPDDIAAYNVGDIVNYGPKGYEVIAKPTAADKADPKSDTVHYRPMANWHLEVGMNVKAYSTLFVFNSGTVWATQNDTTLTQGHIDACLARTEDSAFCTLDGVCFFPMMPAMPTDTPGEYLMFTMASDEVSFANMTAFMTKGSATITINSKQIEVRIDPTSGLEAGPAGLDFAPGFQAYPDADKTKLRELPALTVLNTLLGNKVDKDGVKGLSKNDYTDTDKQIVTGVTAKLGEKQPSMTATGTDNLLTAPSVVGGQPGAKALADIVQTAGNQTIAGTKTFTTSPVVPAKTSVPTAANTTAIATEAQVAALATNGTVFTSWAAIQTYINTLTSAVGAATIRFDMTDATNLGIAGRCIGSMVVANCLGPTNNSHQTALIMFDYANSTFLATPRVFVRNTKSGTAGDWGAPVEMLKSSDVHWG